MAPRTDPDRRYRSNLGPTLRARGFDRSWYGRSSRQWHARCSQCQAMVINGVPTHERGCPNAPKPTPSPE